MAIFVSLEITVCIGTFIGLRCGRSQHANDDDDDDDDVAPPYSYVCFRVYMEAISLSAIVYSLSSK